MFDDNLDNISKFFCYISVETAFHSAIRQGDLGTTIIMLKHHPDLNICDNEGANEGTLDMAS